MKKSPKKLSLNRETLGNLEQVVGGAAPQTNRCPVAESGTGSCYFGFCYTATCPGGCISDFTDPVTLR